MLTGAQYRSSLADGRATFFEGQRIDDLPGHPILGSAVERVAEGYDFLHAQSVDGSSSPLMGVPTSHPDITTYATFLCRRRTTAPRAS